MITTLQIFEAIQTMVAENVPEIRKVYFDVLPEGNEPPSALLRLISCVTEDATAALVKITDKLQIGITDAVGSTGMSDTEQALRLQAKVCALFAPGYLRVAGRALHAVAGDAKREQDTVFVELTLDFFEDRPPTGPELQKIETVETNMQVKE